MTYKPEPCFVCLFQAPVESTVTYPRVREPSNLLSAILGLKFRIGSQHIKVRQSLEQGVTGKPLFGHSASLRRFITTPSVMPFKLLPLSISLYFKTTIWWKWYLLCGVKQGSSQVRIWHTSPPGFTWLYSTATLHVAHSLHSIRSDQ